MSGFDALVIAMALFVGLHFLMSHPLRAPLVGVLGERGFQGVYSLVSLATFIWAVMAYRALDPEPRWWSVPAGLAVVLALVLLFASVLFAGSFVGNPALPQPGAGALAERRPRGVFAITRHPMMWAFGLWGITHMISAPSPATWVLAGGTAFLALAGAAGQDAKKARLMGSSWKQWRKRTAFLPFGRRPEGGWSTAWPGIGPLVGGLVLWLVASWLHGSGVGVQVFPWSL